MLTKLSVDGFKAVPYLETSALMAHKKKRLTFSTTKPNVLVGPNGSGKSALLRTLTLRFLADLTGVSSFDGKYVLGRESEDLWTRVRPWGNEYAFLKGLTCETDNGPVLYYRPSHIPGNESGITTAMMVGYFDEARAYSKLVEDKSSGQQSQALLDRLLSALDGTGLPTGYSYANWRYGTEPKNLEALRPGYASPWDYQAEELKKLVVPTPGAMPLILMDEPEQSLDARAEAKLWSAIAKADCSKMQVIVATHSLYPLMHKDKFNLIETEPGFVKDVLALVG